MSTRTPNPIAVHLSTPVRDAERLAEAMDCDLILAGGRAYLRPREPEPNLNPNPIQRSPQDAR